MTAHSPKSEDPNPRSGGGLICWVLMLMGVSTLATCVLLPEWREYQALSVAEQRENHRLRLIEERIEREEESLIAIQTDPAVVARLARRDLRFHEPFEIGVPVETPAQSSKREKPFVPEPVEPPAWMTAGERYLPRLNYDAVFCDPKTRRIVMTMSVALLCLSMILSPRQGRSVNPA